MDLRLLVIFAGAGVAVWSTLRWQKALQAAMVLVILEGAIRKWLLPGAQDLVYFAKDVVLLGVYMGFLRSRERRTMKPPPMPALYPLLAAAIGFGLFEVFNPDLPNILVGLLGFKAYFFYVPLLYVLPAAFSSDQALGRFLRRYALLSIPVGLLALAQFFSPASSALNAYARNAEGESGYVTTFGSSEFVRVTATFSYISGYSSYLFATAILLLAVLGTLEWRFRRHLTLYLAFGMTLLGMLMTGSRGPVFTLALLFPLYWYLAIARERRGGAIFGRLLLGIALLAVFLSYAGPQALEAFKGRAEGAEDTSSRFAAPFVSPLHLLPAVGLFGNGIGATHQTAMAVTHGIVPYSWLHGLVTEVESGRIMIEIGPVGFFLVYALRIYLIFFALRQVFRLRTAFHRAVATTVFLFCLAELPGGVVFDVTTDVYYWFFAGLLLAVMRLDRAVQPAASPLPLQLPRRVDRPAVPAISAASATRRLGAP